MTDQFTIPESQTLSTENKGNLWTRRKFLGTLSWLSVIGAIHVALLAFVRFMYPRVLFEPSPVFKAGSPKDYQVGEVSTRYKDSHRVWIVREPKGFYAILAICTHLGCTPKWLKAENKFKCPCHGSGFYKSAINFEGPAPRPMERLAISLSEEGELQIDRSKKFPDPADWSKPEAFLRYSG
ncbi:MAG: ubiquinol-cytochrome c reductase iron-sulfur subunit [Deltaproteobacteria bacterium]|nr:ubiquinol-cytochrome c reductase iron-sulfur subunit [Deltaproteobacteria bacterium]